MVECASAGGSCQHAMPLAARYHAQLTDTVGRTSTLDRILHFILFGWGEGEYVGKEREVPNGRERALL